MGGLFGGNASVLSSVMPFAGGSISAGLAASKTGSSGGYGVQLHSAKVTAAASGIERVKAGTVALLHANERVLTAAEAESYRQNQQARLIAQSPSSSSSGSNITVYEYHHHGNVVANSPERYEQEVQQRAAQRSRVRYATSEKQRRAGQFVARGPRF